MPFYTFGIELWSILFGISDSEIVTNIHILKYLGVI